jgi:hypothetical protein
VDYEDRWLESDYLSFATGARAHSMPPPPPNVHLGSLLRARAPRVPLPTGARQRLRLDLADRAAVTDDAHEKLAEAVVQFLDVGEHAPSASAANCSALCRSG